MFNEEIRNKFLQDDSITTGTRGIAKGVFKRISSYEEEIGKDIVCANSEEVARVIDNIVGTRYSSKRTRIYAMRTYARWCKDNTDMEVSDTFFNLDYKLMDDVILKSHSVSNPMHLQRYLDYICDDVELGTPDCVIRAFFWIAYSGVREDDMLKITSDNLDFDNMLIKIGGIEYPIYRESAKTLKMCAYKTSFRIINPRFPNKTDVFKQRDDSGWLLAGTKYGESTTKPGLANIIARVNKKQKSAPESNDESLNLSLSYKRVQLSGIFYREYEKERAGYRPDFSSAAEIFIQGKEYSYSHGLTCRDAKLKQVAREYMKDYEVWKKAYSI